jgi:predicted transglutaminase-like cysteine proteinase
MRSTAAALAITLLATGCAQTAPLSVMPTITGEIGMDFSLLTFCVSHKSETVCQKDIVPAVVDMDSKHYIELEDVNYDDNHKLEYAPGTAPWTIVDGKAVCTGYALYKYNHLIALGWPAGALHIAEAGISGSGSINHAVLMVDGVKDGVRGMYVMSNGIDAVMPIATLHWASWAIFNSKTFQLDLMKI